MGVKTEIIGLYDLIFSTIVCSDNNPLDACVDMDKFICKPQFTPRIEQIKNNEWPRDTVLTTLNSMIENGDCAPFYFPSEIG